MLYQDLYQSLIKMLSPQQNKFSLLYLLENFVLNGTKLPHQHKHKGTLNQFILILPNTQMLSHAYQAQTYDYNVLTRKLICKVTAPCCHNIYRKLPLENCLDVLQPLLFCLPITCLATHAHYLAHQAQLNLSIHQYVESLACANASFKFGQHCPHSTHICKISSTCPWTSQPNFTFSTLKQHATFPNPSFAIHTHTEYPVNANLHRVPHCTFYSQICMMTCSLPSYHHDPTPQESHYHVVIKVTCVVMHAPP